MPFKRRLININACKGAIDWVENRTLQQAWNDCHRGEWMLWLLEEMKGKEGWVDEKEIMLLSCWCARRTLKYIPEGEDRPLKAIEAKEKWTRGEITREEMYIAMDAATVAVSDVTKGAARAATWAAIWAVASASASASAKATAWATVRDIAWFAAYNKESSIQADYIRTQFTPPI